MTQHPVQWKRRILIPFWVVRILIMGFLVASFAYMLANLGEFDELKPALGTIIAFMLFIIIVLLIDILAIVLFLRDALKPGTFLTMNCFQTCFWGAVLIMDFVAMGQGESANSVALGFMIFVFLSFLGLLIYAIVNYRRERAAAKRGQYAPAHNPVAAAPPSYPSPYKSGPEYQQNPTYHSQTTPTIELENQHLPPYQTGAAGYYQQPVKPAHIV